MTDQTPTPSNPCIEAWPEAYSGGYNPYCCRFPKSCSYDAEPAQDARNPAPAPDGTTQGLSGAQTGVRTEWEAYRDGLLMAAQVVHAEARWQTEQDVRGFPLGHAVSLAIADRMTEVEKAIHGIASTIDTGESKETAGKLASANRNVTPGPVSLVSTDGPSLGDALRAAADYQDRPGAYAEIRALAAQADRLERERDAYKRAKAENDDRFQLEAAGYREQVERVLAALDRMDRDGYITEGDDGVLRGHTLSQFTRSIRAALAGSEGGL